MSNVLEFKKPKPAPSETEFCSCEDCTLDREREDYKHAQEIALNGFNHWLESLLK